MTEDKPIDWPDPKIHAKLSWGFDFFRTKRRYGLGIEVCTNGCILVGIRFGSLMLSFGQQVNYQIETTMTTQPK